MKNILLIVPQLTDGGGERVVSELSKSLDSKLYNIYIALYKENITYNYQGTIINLNFSGLSKNYFFRVLQILFRV